jgi:hypothetical protein
MLAMRVRRVETIAVRSERSFDIRAQKGSSAYWV